MFLLCLTRSVFFPTRNPLVFCVTTDMEPVSTATYRTLLARRPCMRFRLTAVAPALLIACFNAKSSVSLSDCPARRTLLVRVDLSMNLLLAMAGTLELHSVVAPGSSFTGLKFF